jgi:hypothetical protein
VNLAGPVGGMWAWPHPLGYALLVAVLYGWGKR